GVSSGKSILISRLLSCITFLIPRLITAKLGGRDDFLCDLIPNRRNPIIEGDRELAGVGRFDCDLLVERTTTVTRRCITSGTDEVGRRRRGQSLCGSDVGEFSRGHR